MMRGVNMLMVTMALLLGVGCEGCEKQLTGSCCKTCSSGKACGDSCIPSNQTCNKYGGCACNGLVETLTNGDD